MPVSGNATFGFPLGWDYRRPDQPDFGGPLRNLQAGNFEQPRALSVEDEWGQWCGYLAFIRDWSLKAANSARLAQSVLDQA